MKVLKFDLHLSYDKLDKPRLKVCHFAFNLCLFVCFYRLLSDCPRCSSMCRTMNSLCYNLRMAICIFVSMFSSYFINRKTGSPWFIKFTPFLLQSYFLVVIAWVASLSLLMLFIYCIFFISFDFNCASLKHLNTFLHGVLENFSFSLEHLNPLSHEWANAHAKWCVLHCSRDYGTSTFTIVWNPQFYILVLFDFHFMISSCCLFWFLL